MSDVINLSKGQNVNLSKVAAGASKFVIGLGWNANPSNPPDLDASAFPCQRDANGDPKLLSPANQSFVFYGNLKSADGAIVHSGDNLTGDGDGDDEQIVIDTALLDPRVDEVIIAVTIHEAQARNQNFGLVRNSYVRILDAAALAADPNAQPIAKYDLEDDAGNATALQFGTLYKKDGEWRFKALGVPASASLKDFVQMLAPAGTVVN